MRRYLLIITSLLLIFTVKAQQPKTDKQTKPLVKTQAQKPPTPSIGGHNIPITLTPLKNCWVFLGCHYGKYKNLADSTFLDAKGKGVFKGKEKLPKGIYFVIPPAKYIAFEVLMDKEQHFSIIADTSNFNKVTITGSVENTIFQQYNNFLSAKVPVLNNLKQQLTLIKNEKEVARIKAELDAKNEELNVYRTNLIKKNPKSMLASFFEVIKPLPELKPTPKKPSGEMDTLAVWRYTKEHYWDGVDFTKEQLVRTPFFEPKIDEYFKNYVIPNPDSLIEEVKYMLTYSQSSKEMHKFLLGKFTDKYINPEYMGQDKVFLYLFNNYYSKGDTSWLGNKQIRYIFDKAYTIMGTQIGEPAPILDLVDNTSKTISLYGVNAPFTVVCIWDPTCGHCKTEIPRLDSMYKAKWKQLGIKIYGINAASKIDFVEWGNFINEKNLDKEGWIHVYQPKEMKAAEEKSGQPNYRQLYDAFVTPTMILLDKEKHIVAKKLSIEQFDEVIQAKIKKGN